MVVKKSHLWSILRERCQGPNRERTSYYPNSGQKCYLSFKNALFHRLTWCVKWYYNRHRILSSQSTWTAKWKFDNRCDFSSTKRTIRFYFSPLSNTLVAKVMSTLNPANKLKTLLHTNAAVKMLRTISSDHTLTMLKTRHLTIFKFEYL